MRGWLPGCFDRARTVEWVWAGWGVCPCGRAGQLTVSRGFVLAGWLVCLVIGVGNTPVVLLLPACVGSVAWWVPPRVWGWHAVGVLGQCALVA